MKNEQEKEIEKLNRKQQLLEQILTKRNSVLQKKITILDSRIIRLEQQISKMLSQMEQIKNERKYGR